MGIQQKFKVNEKSRRLNEKYRGLNEKSGGLNEMAAGGGRTRAVEDCICSVVSVGGMIFKFCNVFYTYSNIFA